MISRTSRSHCRKRFTWVTHVFFPPFSPSVGWCSLRQALIVSLTRVNVLRYKAARCSISQAVQRIILIKRTRYARWSRRAGTVGRSRNNCNQLTNIHFSFFFFFFSCTVNASAYIIPRVSFIFSSYIGSE